MKIDQYECNCCKVRRDAKDVEGNLSASEAWIAVDASNVMAKGNTTRHSIAHICPRCQTGLLAFGINVEWVANGTKA